MFHQIVHVSSEGAAQPSRSADPTLSAVEENLTENKSTMLADYQQDTSSDVESLQTDSQMSSGIKLKQFSQLSDLTGYPRINDQDHGLQAKVDNTHSNKTQADPKRRALVLNPQNPSGVTLSQSQMQRHSGYDAPGFIPEVDAFLSSVGGQDYHHTATEEGQDSQGQPKPNEFEVAVLHAKKIGNHLNQSARPVKAMVFDHSTSNQNEMQFDKSFEVQKNAVSGNAWNTNEYPRDAHLFQCLTQNDPNLNPKTAVNIVGVKGSNKSLDSTCFKQVDHQHAATLYPGHHGNSGTVSNDGNMTNLGSQKQLARGETMHNRTKLHRQDRTTISGVYPGNAHKRSHTGLYGFPNPPPAVQYTSQLFTAPSSSDAHRINIEGLHNQNRRYCRSFGYTNKLRLKLEIIHRIDKGYCDSGADVQSSKYLLQFQNS